MSDSETITAVKKLGGWERLVIFSGVVLTVPLFALLGTAIYAVMTDRTDAVMGVFLSIIAILILWAVIWGMLWIVSGIREGHFNNGNGDTAATLEELRAENERLKKQIAELTKAEGG